MLCCFCVWFEFDSGFGLRIFAQLPFQCVFISEDSNEKKKKIHVENNDLMISGNTSWMWRAISLLIIQFSVQSTD